MGCGNISLHDFDCDLSYLNLGGNVRKNRRKLSGTEGGTHVFDDQIQVGVSINLLHQEKYDEDNIRNVRRGMDLCLS